MFSAGYWSALVATPIPWLSWVRVCLCSGLSSGTAGLALARSSSAALSRATSASCWVLVIVMVASSAVVVVMGDAVVLLGDARLPGGPRPRCVDARVRQRVIALLARGVERLAPGHPGGALGVPPEPLVPLAPAGPLVERQSQQDEHAHPQHHRPEHYLVHACSFSSGSAEISATKSAAVMPLAASTW